MDSLHVAIPHKYCTRDHPKVYPKSPHPRMIKASVPTKELPVKRIKKSYYRGRGRARLWYLLHWEDGSTTLEPCRNLVNCNRLLAEYHSQHLGAPGATWAAKKLFPKRRYERGLFQMWLQAQ